MEEFLTEFHFLRPWVLLLLIIPVMYFFYVFKNDANLSSWEKVCDKKLLDFLLIKGKSTKRKLSVALMYVGLIFAILAAAGPAWKKTQREAVNNKSPLMIVLSLSSDMQFDDIKPNRLIRAKIEITQLLNMVKSVESGLIVYTSEPFLISPLSSDSDIVINLLDAVDESIMPVNGDNLERAIDMAMEKIKDSGYNSGNIVVFSADSGTVFEKSVKSAQKALSQNIKVSVVNMSIGTNNKLMQIAKDGGGKYLQSGQDIKSLADFILSLKSEIMLSKNKAADWDDYGWYLIIVPLLCCLHFFRRGVLVILFLTSFTTIAQAGFWFSDNQLAKKSFDEKNYEKAAMFFNNNKWKAAAFYRAGDYENAAQFLKNEKDLDSLYNYGNAVAKLGNIDEAIKTYEAVLKQDKNHKDAKFNLEYLKKQKQNNNSKNKKDNKDQNNKQSKNEQAQKQQGQQQNQQNQQQEQSDNQEQKNQQNQQQEQSENQKQDKEDNKEQAKAQNAQSQVQAEDERKDKQSKDNSKENRDNNQNKKQNQSVEKQKIKQANMKQGEKDEKYNEEIQAREQKFRKIPEDKGGLLRLFIQKEYNKNRYGE